MGSVSTSLTDSIGFVPRLGSWLLAGNGRLQLSGQWVNVKEGPLWAVRAVGRMAGWPSIDYWVCSTRLAISTPVAGSHPNISRICQFVEVLQEIPHTNIVIIG